MENGKLRADLLAAQRWRVTLKGVLFRGGELFGKWKE